MARSELTLIYCLNEHVWRNSEQAFPQHFFVHFRDVTVGLVCCQARSTIVHVTLI